MYFRDNLSVHSYCYLKISTITRILCQVEQNLWVRLTLTKQRLDCTFKYIIPDCHIKVFHLEIEFFVGRLVAISRQ